VSVHEAVASVTLSGSREQYVCGVGFLIAVLLKLLETWFAIADLKFRVENHIGVLAWFASVSSGPLSLLTSTTRNGVGSSTGSRCRGLNGVFILRQVAHAFVALTSSTLCAGSVWRLVCRASLTFLFKIKSIGRVLASWASTAILVLIGYQPRLTARAGERDSVVKLGGAALLFSYLEFKLGGQCH